MASNTKSAKARRKRNRQRANRRKRICPTHQISLVKQVGKYGDWWKCPNEGCDIRLGGGQTSTPCDCETARLRRAAHGAFDPLWKDKRPFATRSDAYAWLAGILGISGKDCHIGYFTSDQCRAVLKAIRVLMTPGVVR